MASNKTAYRVNGIQYRKIPGFNNYGISSKGNVVNLKTKETLRPKDFDHFSGRYNLYQRGNQKTVNTLSLMEMTYSEKTIRSFLSMVSIFII